jgi:hypothetical protein
MLPDPPPERRFTFTYENDRLRVDFPAPRWEPVLKSCSIMFIFLASIPGVVLGLVALYHGLHNVPLTWKDDYFPGTCITLGFGAFGLLIDLLFELPGKWTRTTIYADPMGIRVCHRGLLSHKEKQADAAEIRQPKLDCVVTQDRSISYGLPTPARTMLNGCAMLSARSWLPHDRTREQLLCWWQPKTATWMRGACS